MQLKEKKQTNKHFRAACVAKICISEAVLLFGVVFFPHSSGMALGLEMLPCWLVSKLVHHGTD